MGSFNVGMVAVSLPVERCNELRLQRAHKPFYGWHHKERNQERQDRQRESGPCCASFAKSFPWIWRDKPRGMEQHRHGDNICIAQRGILYGNCGTTHCTDLL